MVRVFLTTDRMVKYEFGMGQVVADTLIVVSSVNNYGYSSSATTTQNAMYRLSAIAGWDDGSGVVEEKTGPGPAMEIGNGSVCTNLSV